MLMEELARFVTGMLEWVSSSIVTDRKNPYMKDGRDDYWVGEY